MPGVEELDSLLLSLQALKPPGASKSKISSITTICVENPQVDSVIAQKLYTHFKKTFPTHKLGILFVVDSVTRQWIEKAKQSGQELSGTSAPNGTYASGVQRLTELMPSLIDDLARVAPQDQKAKIQNLVDIWDRGGTFPARMIAGFKQKLTGALQLAKNNIPQDQWGPVLAALYPQNASTQPPAPVPPPGWQPPNAQVGQDYGSSLEQSRKRDRSRSPDYHRDGGHGSNRRPSPVYGTYDPTIKDPQEQNESEARGRRGGKYRQRSPQRGRNSNGNGTGNGNANSHSNTPTMPSSRPKWLSHDPSIPANHIKVLSRTLFVGGCAAPEAELRAIFARFGEVQTCIANTDKRHAFVKMCTRTDAVRAKEGMEELANREPGILSKARQTKWGVGFGPRECCDYATGESIVPISSLTEADLKWAVTAEYGGTGGRTVQSGMVMEEPDIEIGAGVSSKAMSKRLGPDQGPKGRGGRHGGRDGGRHRKGDGGGGGQGQNGHQQAQQRFESPRPQEQVAFQPPPPVPQFGFSFATPGSGGPPY
ncbi:hypothetical protein ANO11243_016220 [Dothideomycetidae sp. 11243]|nr:hypothetical protein ANO11243_016220 [fungal sp. No.11243]